MELEPGPDGATGHGHKVMAAYAAIIGFGTLAVLGILKAGSGRRATEQHSTEEVEAGHGAEQFLWKLLLATAIIIVVARLVGLAFQRINQPQVVGEIFAGILLGPSVLGFVWPGGPSALFPEEILPYLDTLAQIGLIFFMFLVGLELDVRLIKGRGHLAATVSHVSIVLPFVLGAGLAYLIFPTLGSTDGRFSSFALFMGASMSITAFPVLARILTERNLYKTPLGAVTLTCAAVDDVTAWCLLAVVVAVARSSSSIDAVQTIGLTVIFISFMVLVVRPLVARVARYLEDRGSLGGGMLAMLFVGVLLSALATDRIGIHAIFGAFLFGAIMPQRSELVHELTVKLEDFTVVFLLPLFFAFNGLRTDVWLIGSNATLWGYCALVLLVAVVGKWGGSTLTARVMGLPGRESMALGALMNTRGLTELVILNIGLELGVIPPTLFAMLVIMALVTTFMTTPALSLIYRDHPPEPTDNVVDLTDDHGAPPYRILVPISKGATGHQLLHAALQLARDHEEPEIVLLRVVQVPGSSYRAGPRARESLITGAGEGLRPLVQLVEGAGCRAVPVTMATGDVADAIVGEVERRQPSLVLLGWQRPLFGSQILGGVVGEVLRRATTDVAVLVDPVGAGVNLAKGAKILVPYGGGYHEDVGLDIALRMAQASGAGITLLGPPGESEVHELADRAALAYQGTGVWTVPVPVGDDPGLVLVEHARDADLVVLGVGDAWVKDQRTLGGLREAVAARTVAPLIIVRSHGQKSRRRGPKEWIVEGGSALEPPLDDDEIAQHLA
ncbi:MAG: cation:proton antiporter domain-containing protein [Acidimicrobiia bacterium]